MPAQPGQVQRAALGVGEQCRPRRRLRRGQRPGHPLDRGQRLVAGTAGEPAAQDADPQAGRRRVERGHRRLGRPGHLRRIGRIGALHQVVGEGQVAEAAGEGADMVEAVHERDHAGAGQPAEGRLQPEHAAQRGRRPHRAVGVGTQGERQQPGGDRRGRAAGHAVRIVPVCGGAAMGVSVGKP